MWSLNQLFISLKNSNFFFSWSCVTRVNKCITKVVIYLKNRRGLESGFFCSVSKNYTYGNHKDLCSRTEEGSTVGREPQIHSVLATCQTCRTERSRRLRLRQVSDQRNGTVALGVGGTHVARVPGEAGLQVEHDLGVGKVSVRLQKILIMKFETVNTINPNTQQQNTKYILSVFIFFYKRNKIYKASIFKRQNKNEISST